jgi:crotonobetainyl-CoA:carnitine CoA-transferase CaiB-like acyl-CoA transferase
MHPSEGDIMFTDQPARFGDGAASNARLQPRLGEHSVEILREAGLADTAIEALLESGATIDPNRKAHAAE